MEEVLYRASISQGICDALSELRGFQVVVDESSGGGVPCQEDTESNIRQEEGTIQLTSHASSERQHDPPPFSVSLRGRGPREDARARRRYMEDSGTVTDGFVGST